MAIFKIEVPNLSESISEAEVSDIKKSKGDFVQKDEVVFELETDKAALEVVAPCSGVLVSMDCSVDDLVSAGQIIASIDSDADSTSENSIQSEKPKNVEINYHHEDKKIIPKKPSPSIVKSSSIVSNQPEVSQPQVQPIHNVCTINENSSVASSDARPQRVVKMSRMRSKIAQRLKDSQNTAAILSTFNEVDMTNVINLRSSYKEKFEKIHGVKLGFMSFFLKAAVHALLEIQDINAEIRGNDIIYKDYCDIGVAVGTENGLVVPVVRNAQKLSFHEIELEILRLAKKARDNKLTVDDMSGGTFTISNAGIYGSLLSTPIINPPQSGILGMHTIQKRPVAVSGQVEIRDMMYLALSYDHRIVDGKGAVTFLVRIKQLIEDPSRMLLKI